MLIKFDINKLRVETYWVKSLTTAFGGAIRVLDEERSTPDREVYMRIPIPMAVVRQFKQQHKTMRYMRPCLVAVTYYENMAVALERHMLGCMGTRTTDNVKGEIVPWRPVSSHNIETFIEPLVKKYQWYFDGRYMFSFGEEQENESAVEKAVRTGEFLTKDGRFRCINVDTVGLHQIADTAKLSLADRNCLAYVTKNGTYAISPPIWKDAASVGQARIKGIGLGDAERDFQFDTVDEFCAVNISFTLKAAKLLSEEFGFDAIEPLNLPSLMIRLQTVNLPRVPQEVKDTFDSGIKFTHTLAWLLGYAHRCKTLETYATIRSLLKYLTASGLFLRSAFDSQNIFRGEHSYDSIPVLTKEQAIENEKNLSVNERLAVVSNMRATQRPHFTPVFDSDEA